MFSKDFMAKNGKSPMLYDNVSIETLGKIVPPSKVFSKMPSEITDDLLVIMKQKIGEAIKNRVMKDCPKKCLTK